MLLGDFMDSDPWAYFKLFSGRCCEYCGQPFVQRVDYLNAEAVIKCGCPRTYHYDPIKQYFLPDNTDAAYHYYSSTCP